MEKIGEKPKYDFIDVKIVRPDEKRKIITLYVPNSQANDLEREFVPKDKHCVYKERNFPEMCRTYFEIQPSKEGSGELTKQIVKELGIID